MNCPWYDSCYNNDNTVDANTNNTNTCISVAINNIKLCWYNQAIQGVIFLFWIYTYLFGMTEHVFHCVSMLSSLNAFIQARITYYSL